MAAADAQITAQTLLNLSTGLQQLIEVGAMSRNLDEMIARAKAAGAEVLTTSAGQGEGSPIPFYERYGLERTGEIAFDDEVMLQLRL